MKHLKKFTILLALVMLISVFAGCGKKQQIDATKSQLYIGIFDGGFGDEWLEPLAERFEQAYAETSFEEGKKGVEIIPYAGVNDMVASSLLESMSGLQYEVFFTEGDWLQDMIDRNLLLDITDAVTEDLLPGESKTIESKMSDEQKAFFSRETYNTDNPSYYAIPFYSATHGLFYNIDLFDREELYFAKGGCPSEHRYPDSGYQEGVLKFTNLAGERSAGPNGEYGDYDDGLPATFEDFEEWLISAVENGITSAVTWTGQFSTFYTNYILDAMFYQSEGVDKAGLYYTFKEGEEFEAVKFDNAGNVLLDSKGMPQTETLTLSEDTFNDLLRQPGRYYSLKFFKMLTEYADPGVEESTTNTQAQADFLNDDKKIPFLVEGNWWMNEAKNAGTFEERKKDPQEVNYSILPLPHVTEDKIGSDNILYDGNNAMTFVNANIAPEKVKLAKEFIKFACTDISCAEFISVTGNAKDLKFEIDKNSDLYKGLTPFAKNYLEVKQHSITAYKGFTSPTTKAELISAGINVVSSVNPWNTEVNGTSKIPVNAFIFDGDTLNQVFKGIYDLNVA